MFVPSKGLSLLISVSIILLAPGIGGYQAVAQSVERPAVASSRPAVLTLPAHTDLTSLGALAAKIPGQSFLPATTQGPVARITVVGAPVAARKADRSVAAQLQAAARKFVEFTGKNMSDVGRAFFDQSTLSPEFATAGTFSRRLDLSPARRTDSNLMLSSGLGGRDERRDAVRSTRFNDGQEPSPVKEFRYQRPFEIRVAGATLGGLGSFPLLAGIFGTLGIHSNTAAGTLLAVGAASTSTAWLMTRPTKTPPSHMDNGRHEEFLVFLGLAGGAWGGVSVYELISKGAIESNTWIMAAIFGVTAVGLVAVGALKALNDRTATQTTRSLAAMMTFAAYLGGISTMFILKDWHSGLGVLAGFGIAISGALVGGGLAPVVAAIRKAFPPGSGTKAERAGELLASKAATHTRAVFLSIIGVGIAIAMVGMLAPIGAWTAFAPVVAMLAGVMFLNLSRRP